MVSFLPVLHQEKVEYRLLYEDLTTAQYLPRLDPADAKMFFPSDLCRWFLNQI